MIAVPSGPDVVELGTFAPGWLAPRTRTLARGGASPVAIRPTDALIGPGHAFCQDSRSALRSEQACITRSGRVHSRTPSARASLRARASPGGRFHRRQPAQRAATNAEMSGQVSQGQVQCWMGVRVAAIAGESPGVGRGGDRGREVAADADVSRECECGVGVSEQRADHGWVEPDVEEQPARRDVAKVMGVPDG